MHAKACNYELKVYLLKIQAAPANKVTIWKNMVKPF
jgi:hypothetical protein